MRAKISPYISGVRVTTGKAEFLDRLTEMPISVHPYVINRFTRPLILIGMSRCYLIFLLLILVGGFMREKLKQRLLAHRIYITTLKFILQ
jgi:hypothetical protein